jgi:hypothetical protein
MSGRGFGEIPERRILTFRLPGMRRVRVQELLTREIRKDTSRRIRRGYEPLIPVWSGRLAFRGSVLRYFGYRELEGAGSCCSRDREVPKRENPKTDGGVVWSRNRVTHFGISGFGFSAIPRTRNRVLRTLETPKSRKRRIVGVGLWSYISAVRVRLSGSSEDKESGRLVLETPK